MSDRTYMEQQIRRAKAVVAKRPQSKAAQDRLEFLLEQYRAIDTTVWRCPSLSLDEMRCSRG